MVYTKNSDLKKVIRKRKMKVLTDRQKKRLKKHRQNHIKDKNPLQMVSKHMKVMRDLMKQGFSFKKSHIEAQNKYPMLSG